jgi:hypothetical protein
MPTKEWIKANDSKIKEYRKRWYIKNKDTEILRIRKRRDGIKKWLDSYKDNLKCEICGENHPACLTFHHKQPARKEGNVSFIVHSGWGLGRIKREIEKCRVLCENCHRKLHWKNKI